MPNRSRKFTVGLVHPGPSFIVSAITRRAAATMSSSSFSRLASIMRSRFRVARTHVKRKVDSMRARCPGDTVAGGDSPSRFSARASAPARTSSPAGMPCRAAARSIRSHSVELDNALQVLGATNVAGVLGDVGSAAGCHAILAAAIEQLGNIDVLVNNAGIWNGLPIEEVDEATWDRMNAVNLKGVFFCTQAALPSLRKRAGNVVNVASESGLVGNPDMSVYCATKGGVCNLTRALAAELAPGVRVNAVCPGATRTSMLEQDAARAGDVETGLKALERYAPLERIAEPDEIAQAILYLSDPATRFATGTLLVVDGGSIACRR